MQSQQPVPQQVRFLPIWGKWHQHVLTYCIWQSGPLVCLWLVLLLALLSTSLHISRN